MLRKIVGIVLFLVCFWCVFSLFDSYNATKSANHEIKTETADSVNNIVSAQEISHETLKVHSSIESMRSNRELKAGMTVQTTGYYKVNDGGAALYNIRSPKSGDVEDGGSVIFLANGNIADLITDGKVNAKQFGAIGDGVTDDTKAIKNAINFGLPVFFPKGKFVVNETLVLDHRSLYGSSQSWGNETVVILREGAAIHLKGYNSLNNISISRKGYPKQESTTKGIWIEGAFNRLNNVNIYNQAVGIFMTNDRSGCVYNHIVDGVIANCFEGIYMQAQGKGWVNENTFENINIRQTTDFRKHVDTLTNALHIKDKFAVTMTYSNDAIHGINMNKFLCMNLEGCYNGFCVSAINCVFVSNRTEKNKIAYYFMDYQSINDDGSLGRCFKSSSNIIINGVIRNIKQDGDENREPRVYTTVAGTTIYKVKSD